MKYKAAIPVLVGTIFLSGCGQYNVLSKIADTETGTENVMTEAKISETDASEQMSESGSENKEDVEERPKYEASDYVDTGACDLAKIKVKSCEVSKEEALEAIRELMKEKEIYSDSQTVKRSDIVNIDYTATEKGSSEPYVNVTDQDTEIENSIFPEEVKRKIIGAKGGDVIECEYTFSDDWADDTYKGKTFVYRITVNEIKGMDLTDDVAIDLSSSAVVTAEEYIEYAKAMLLIQKQDAALEEAVSELMKQCVITGYPDDVLKYDVQAAVIEIYDNANIDEATSDALKTAISDNLGYDNSEDYLSDLSATVKENLEYEMKILALAEKFDIMADDADLAQVKEKLKEKINGEG